MKEHSRVAINGGLQPVEYSDTQQFSGGHLTSQKFNIEVEIFVIQLVNDPLPDMIFIA